MSKVADNKQRKRLAILQAAEQVFLSQGFEQASMDQIAAQAQATKQTVYRYFPSKLDLFSATLQQIAQQPEYGFAKGLDQGQPQQGLIEFARGFVAAHLSGSHLALYRLLVAEGGRNPQLTEAFWQQGPNDVEQRLTDYLAHHFQLDESLAKRMADHFTAMLLAPRAEVLIGRPRPTAAELELHSQNVVALLLRALAKTN